MNSLAYRKNEAAILSGEVPVKYTRLLPHIPGRKIIEIGSAEGVLSLLLAREGREVIGVEKSRERHADAIKLARAWGVNGSFCFVNGEIGDNLDLLKGQDTLVAVRMIYYLRYELDRVFDVVAKYVPNVVLCGNRNRADRYRAGAKDRKDGPHNFYASREGMRTLLERHGYTIVEEVTEGDEIVVGRMDRPEYHQVQDLAA